jgi:hypothetical protein
MGWRRSGYPVGASDVTDAKTASVTLRDGWGMVDGILAEAKRESGARGKDVVDKYFDFQA